MRKCNLTDEQKDRVAKMDAEHYCKLYGIEDPDKKSKVFKLMRQECDEIEKHEFLKKRGVQK